MVPLSILDLVPIRADASPGQALRESLELARLADRLGYARYWVAEHHNMVGIGSAATSVVIGFLAAGTSRIRIGSGGIMLPNHSPMAIAEQFGTLESLYPGRIDLGLGRAPGTDMMTARALRRDMTDSGDRFPQDVVELQMYFEEPEANQRIRAVPGAGLKVPLWLLGSSLFSAQLAAMLGLPFAFASHFAPDMLMEALAIYRARFEPSATLDKPHAMVAANLFAADTEAEARRIFSSAQQQFANLRRGTPGKLPPPVDDIESWWSSPAEKMMVDRALGTMAAVGTPDQVAGKLSEIVRATQADELILAGQIYDHAARLRSFQIGAEVRERIG